VLVAGEGEAEEAGRLAAELEAGGGRPAVFVTAGPDDAGALVEYVEELFRA
jgi:hypothetical protein